MAEPDSWSSIRDNGLFSTTAIPDRYRLTGMPRRRIEAEHRPEKVSLQDDRLGRIVIRDQKPMGEERLRIALIDGTTPSEWYSYLNARVFFWVSYDRLLGLLNARSYRREEHDVLKIQSEPLIRAHLNQIMLCHMNSGNTFPVPHRRGMDAFKTVADYPVGVRSGRPKPAVVELTVEGSVLDIRRYVVEVNRMRGAEVISNVYRR